jgi:hypothetical protein
MGSTIRRLHSMTTPRRVVVEAKHKRNAPELESIVVVVIPDDEPDFSHIDDVQQARYERGELTLYGIRAEAKIVVDEVVQTITSGGLWGIESDAGDDYFHEVAEEEYNDLRKILKTLGVATSELPNKLDKKQIEWRT